MSCACIQDPIFVGFSSWTSPTLSIPHHLSPVSPSGSLRSPPWARHILVLTTFNLTCFSLLRCETIPDNGSLPQSPLQSPLCRRQPPFWHLSSQFNFTWFKTSSVIWQNQYNIVKFKNKIKLKKKWNKRNQKCKKKTTTSNLWNYIPFTHV